MFDVGRRLGLPVKRGNHAGHDQQTQYLGQVRSRTKEGIRLSGTGAEHDNEWTAQMGVFLHHLGSGDTSDLETEEDCRRAITSVYYGHVTGEFDDIAYNFLVCPHGHVYEGRGYERGEGNHEGYIEGVGRNAGFYSIVGMIRSSNVASEAMLRAMRNLIQHLRTEAPRKAGNRILPHSFGYDTDCPGNLHMYARPGSTIDPSVPWRGPADIYVYRTQKFVNETYDTAPGYVICQETGYISWSTVLSLTQGLQHELGLSPTVQNLTWSRTRTSSGSTTAPCGARVTGPRRSSSGGAATPRTPWNSSTPTWAWTTRTSTSAMPCGRTSCAPSCAWTSSGRCPVVTGASAPSRSG
ncbi:peptidoglycan recognition family protein [Streptomyces sp. Qhu-G9]|uniref:peptidoglycan recognition protein family protein n=1 Tax=Streptomyces sp. Qhu-G9 TaxID=3452799 RepID=UPI0022ABCD65|nr:peptidoglycan recognition family protein [Streptomyces aurantiacus]WAU83411.1 peptidoglycan recognition family protein [Streptomyces aurantiacus]